MKVSLLLLKRPRFFGLSELLLLFQNYENVPKMLKMALFVLRLVPKTLRDLAYRYGNEVEEEVNEEVFSTVASSTTPSQEPGSVTTRLLPQLSTGSVNEIEHVVYEGRFPKISTENLNDEITETKVKTAIRMGKFKCSLSYGNGS